MDSTSRVIISTIILLSSQYLHIITNSFFPPFTSDPFICDHEVQDYIKRTETTAKELIELLENNYLLSPNNLLYIQFLLVALNEDELVKEIRAFVKYSNKSKPQLYIDAAVRSSGRQLFR